MRAGSWPAILGIYLFGICGASTVSKLVPLAGDVERTFGISGADFGWLVALVALPAAIFAIPSGIVVDRFGSKRVLIIAGLAGLSANAIYLAATSLALIYAARIIEGLAIVHVYTAGPALLMATTQDDRRTRAMTLWSTYAPVGTALGLAAAGLFAETPDWRKAFVAHGVLFGLTALLGLLQPHIPPAMLAARSFGQRLADLTLAFRRPQLVALGAALFMTVGMGMGANITLPSFIARVHGMAAGNASAMVASVTITMVLGSALAGFLLTRLPSARSLFAAIAIGGLVAGSMCFAPLLSTEQRFGCMIAWFVLSGAALATITAALPLVADPARPGAAASLLNFSGAVAALLTPPLWLGVGASGEWSSFQILFALGWSLALAAFLLVPVLAARHQPQQLRETSV